MRTWLRTAAALLLTATMSGPSDILAQSQEDKTAKQPATARLDPKRAQKALREGESAEERGGLVEALAAYDRAVRLNPADAAALAHDAALRSQLVHARVDEAERLAAAGEVEQASRELRAALRLDPGNPYVSERLSQISEMPRLPLPGPASEPQLAGIPRLRPQSGKRNFALRGDVRTAYQQVALAFGLKAVFDADLPARDVRLKVDDVDFAAAIDILQTQTGTFIRPLDSDTMFVAADTLEKRRQYGLTVERTFLLSDSVGPEEMSELLRILRDITGSTHIELNAVSRSMTLRESPQIVELAGKLLQQVEQARGELLLDIELLEVDRNKALQLGIMPPTSARLIALNPNAVQSLLHATDLSSLTALLQQVFGAPAAGGALVPPFLLLGGGKTTLLYTLPSAAATFSDALTLVRSGRRVLLRAQDGKPATIFVGDRFPITLSLLSSSIGSSSFVPLIGGNIFPRSDFAVGNDPVALLAVDFNGDGRRDLAVVNHNDNSITILLNQINQGQINFTQATGSPIKLPATETGPIAIASAIFNEASGQTDLVVVNQGSNNLTILHGDGTGAFKEAANSPIAVGNSPTAVAVGTFNKNTDSHLDIAVTNSKDNTLTVLLGDGAGNFKPAPGSPFPLASNEQNPVALATADFNSDGLLDLAIVNQSTGVVGQTTGNVAIFLGKGDGTFTEATRSPIAVGQLSVAIAAGDLNGDTKPDLAVVNQTDNSVTVLLNNGDATFAAAPNSPLSTGAGSTPKGVAIADFNADGNGDIVVTNSGLNSISLYLGLGAGLFAPKADLPAAPGGGPGAILAADLTNGGLPDAAFTEEASNQVSIIFSPSSFAPGGTSGLAQQPYPASEYVDLGVKIKATPALHPQNEVTLLLEFEIRALSGQNVNGIPILSNRTLTQSVRVKEDETTLIGGLFDNEETRTLSGLPVLGQVAVAKDFFSLRNRQSTDNELLILVTPRRLRLPARISHSIYAGRGAGPPSRGGTLAAPASPQP